MVDRRSFLYGSVLMLAAPLAAEGQPAAKMRTVGFLAYEAYAYEVSFHSALLPLGWQERRNLVVERRYAQSPARLSELAAELVQLAPDVIVASNAGLARIVRRETNSTPIVVLVAGDLVAAGLVESLARPGGNVTGTQIVQHDLIGKRLQLLREASANLTRVAALTDLVTSDILAVQKNRELFETMARTLSMEPFWYQVSDVGEIEDRFKTMVHQRTQGIIVLGSPFTFANVRPLTELAAKYKIAATYEAKVFVVGGGLMSYGIDFNDAFALGAAYVDRILRGAKPGDLPVQQPTKFELVINLKTAKLLGLTIPPSLLARADEVIE
jgi:putative ABC transport system substrate-binding protein